MTWRVGFLFGALLACGSPPAAPLARVPVQREPREATSVLPDFDWERVSAGNGVSLEVPDARNWRHDGGRDWVRLVHGPSSTSLETRRFSAESAVSPAACAERAELSLGAEPNDADGVIERRAVATRDAMRAELVVRVQASSAGGVLGTVDAAAAGVGVCVALRFRAETRGDGREAEIGKRLAFTADRVVPSLELDRIEDRVTAPRDLDRQSP